MEKLPTLHTKEFNIKNLTKDLFKHLLVFLKNNIIFLLGIFLFLYKYLLLEVLLNLNIRFEAILYSIFVILFILFPTFNKCSKKSLIYLNIIYAFITFLILDNYVYYTYSNNFLSFYQLDNLKYTEQITTNLPYLMRFRTTFIFVIDNLILFIISIVLLKVKKLSFPSPNKHWIRYVFLILLLVFNIVLAESKLDFIYEDFIYNKTLMVEHLSIYYYHIEDFKDYFEHLIFREKVDYEKLDIAYEENKKDKSTNCDYTGIANGKNVIIVQLLHFFH